MRQQSKIITMLVLLAGLLGLVVARVGAASVTVSAPTVEAQPGNTVDVPIQLAGAQGLGAIHLELVYDPKVLTAEAVTKGALAGNNSLMESNVKQAGRVVIGLITLDGVTGDGALVTVRFKAQGDAGASSALTLENNQAWERDSKAEVLVNAQPGKVTLAAGLPSWLIPALAAFAALLFFMILFFILMRRRRPAQAYAPQPAYAQPAYAPPQRARVAPPAASPGRPSNAPADLPEGRSAAPTNRAAFQRAEDEYFKLKGQRSMGRITQEQFEAKLRELMVQDAQGRYWMLGADTGKWYVHNGQAWVEQQPY